MWYLMQMHEFQIDKKQWPLKVRPANQFDQEFYYELSV